MAVVSRLSERARRGLRFRHRSWTDGHTSWLQWVRARPLYRQSTRIAIPLLGAVPIWSSLVVVGYAAGWTVHKHRANTQLGGQLKTPTGSGATCVESTPQMGQLAGVLDIPTLGLSAPVEQGTDDAELSVAAGHAPASAWPGEHGTAVVLAHDVSYFVHLGHLKVGDLVTYRNQCRKLTFQVTGKQIVNAGVAVYNSPTPTLLLDTCWPTNALFFTSQRLLVTAALVPNAPSGPSTNKGSPGLSMDWLQAPTVTTINYTTPAPAALVAQGLTLTQNETPIDRKSTRLNSSHANIS